jgi:TPR repeat protein
LPVEKITFDMKTLRIIPLVLISLMSFPSWSADFEKGLTAYDNGDYETALRMWTSLADRGHEKAQVNLAVMHLRGQGVPKDQRKALRYLTPAAERGNSVAQRYLGMMYHRGNGVIQDFQTAFHWYYLAAEQGNVLAQYSLGSAYFSGRGVPKNYMLAHMWWNI